MIKIDGSLGEGGGQIIRTALSLSLITQKPFSIINIRSKRKKPGLLRQHLTAVNAAAKIGNAVVKGNSIHSDNITFKPKEIIPGKYKFCIGTAGSCTLVFQTILPALLTANDISEITLEGGTHNPFAPTFDYLDKVFISILNRMGMQINLNLTAPGFYPAGGGSFTAKIKPVEVLKEINLSKRGKIKRKLIKSYVSQLPLSIAQGELSEIKNKLSLKDNECQLVNIENSPGPGNVISAEIESNELTEVFTGFGIKGVSGKVIAKRIVNNIKEYLSIDVPVGRHLADQLLIPLCLAGGGSYNTLSLTKHTTTNIEIIKMFLDIKIDAKQYDDRIFRINISQ